MAALDALPDDLLLAILQRLDIADRLRARFASRRLTQQGAPAVRSLVVRGGELPAVAWRAFPAATRLVVLLTEVPSVEVRRGPAGRLIQQRGSSGGRP
jgi:hypothetical protein